MIPRRSLLAGGAVIGAAGITAGAVTGRIVRTDPTPSEADVGFCRDMAAHHVQALGMCQRVLGRDTGDAVQAAAAEVVQNQAIEVGMMRAWLADWGESTAPPIEVMAWMHGGVARRPDSMPGYATDAELRELSTATGPERGRRWLELMRAHHVGGVAMAEAAVRLASADKVVRLARTQAETQAFEIEQFDLLLAAIDH